MIATGKAMIGYGLVVATLYAGQVTLDLVVPARLWFEVHSVKIKDTVVGTAPFMVVYRDINAPFYGEWKAEVERKEPDGNFTLVCQAGGKNNYSPQNVLPAPLDLDWWTFPVRCDLPKGAYRLETVWRIFPKGIAAREVRNISNVFEVKDDGQ